MKNARTRQKLRLEVIEAMKLNESFGGVENSNVTIGRIMAIMEISEVDMVAVPIRVIMGEEG